MKSRANEEQIEKEPAMAKGVCGRLCHWGPLGAIGKLTKYGIILKTTQLVGNFHLVNLTIMLQNGHIRGSFGHHPKGSFWVQYQ